MYELKKIGKVFTSKFVGTGPLSYKKRIYRAAVSQRLRNTALMEQRINLHLKTRCVCSYTLYRIFTKAVKRLHKLKLVNEIILYYGARSKKNIKFVT